MTDTPKRKVINYLHPANRTYNAPAGCILMSEHPENDYQGTAFAVVDPMGLIMPPDEADAFAAEICRRWNAFSEKGAQ